MRPTPNHWLEQKRLNGPPGENLGHFIDGHFSIIVAEGNGWDHVSVSRRDRCPTWEEMDRIKRRIFRDDEVVMQLHVNNGSKVNVHPFCLHLWRPQTREEIAETRARWIAAGEVWPYGDLEPAGAIPMPPHEAV
jgi:hypothetical protein